MVVHVAMDDQCDYVMVYSYRKLQACDRVTKHSVTHHVEVTSRDHFQSGKRKSALNIVA